MYFCSPAGTLGAVADVFSFPGTCNRSNYSSISVHNQRKRRSLMTTATTPSTMADAWDRRLTSRADRSAAGKALRVRVPRSSHAQWSSEPERPDPVSLLQKANRTRLEQLVPIVRSYCPPYRVLSGLRCQGGSAD